MRSLQYSATAPAEHLTQHWKCVSHVSHQLTSGAADSMHVCAWLEGEHSQYMLYVNLVDEASRFHLGRQRQQSMVIRSGTLLFSSKVLHPSLVMLCSHKSGRSAVELSMRLISGTFHSTPLPWLPVLSNNEPPALRRKAANDKLVEKIVKHDSWPIQPDILNPPLLWLTSRKPLWLDLQPVDIKYRWRHNWKSAQVVISHLVCDPTIWQPGFDLPRQQWSLLNRFRTEQGHCGACRKKWWLTDTDLCPCVETQTMLYIVKSGPLTKLNGGLSQLHSADENTVLWLTSYGSWHAYEKKN